MVAAGTVKHFMLKYATAGELVIRATHHVWRHDVGAKMFKYLGRLLSWKSKGGCDLLCCVCLISALASTLFINDIICIVLTEFVLKLVHLHKLLAKSFLLALASSSNIGSSAMPSATPRIS
ncbi:hypothetical protein Cni_G05135 [Canna indica]|uniref:Citrate transporter-like domain-containing protein n=1 Tax=Canna indica TaxID=4628 RepID=A0AAQ3Q3F9_9LILI|nr:hypothetical protein Cni_G05135 [Canna indica]